MRAGDAAALGEPARERRAEAAHLPHRLQGPVLWQARVADEREGAHSPLHQGLFRPPL